jgi:hypothetical protein
VKCWGRNTTGQLGDGTNADSNLPVPVSGISAAIAVSAGDSHTCAVVSGGTVECWGIVLILSAVPSSGAVPLTVTFTAEATVSDPDGGSIVKYEWDFDGDGTFDQNTGTTNTASHTYTTAGSFTAKVRVTDDKGRTAEDITFVEAGALKGTLTLSGREKSATGFNGAFGESVWSVSADVTLSLDQEGFHFDQSSTSGTFSEVQTVNSGTPPGCSFTITTIGDFTGGGIAFDPLCSSGCFFTLTGPGTETTTGTKPGGTIENPCVDASESRTVSVSSSVGTNFGGTLAWLYKAIRSPDGTLLRMEFGRTEEINDPLGNTFEVTTTGRLE